MDICTKELKIDFSCIDMRRSFVGGSFSFISVEWINGNHNYQLHGAHPTTYFGTNESQVTFQNFRFSIYQKNILLG